MAKDLLRGTRTEELIKEGKIEDLRQKGPGVILPWHKEAPSWAMPVFTAGLTAATLGAGGLGAGVGAARGAAAAPQVLGLGGTAGRFGAAAAPTVARTAGAGRLATAGRAAAGAARAGAVPGRVAGGAARGAGRAFGRLPWYGKGAVLAGGGYGAVTGIQALRGRGKTPEQEAQEGVETGDWSDVDLNTDEAWQLYLAYAAQQGEPQLAEAMAAYDTWKASQQQAVTEAGMPEVVTLPTGQVGYWYFDPNTASMQFQMLQQAPPPEEEEEPMSWQERVAQAEYMARPENWVQAAILRGQTARVPGAVAGLTPGLEAGQHLLEGTVYQPTVASPQAWYDMTPTERAQMRGFLQAGYGGMTPEEYEHQVRMMAPPGGRARPLVYE